jgi:hypothetical protein
MKWSGSQFVVVHKNNFFFVPVVLVALAFAGGALYGANRMRQVHEAELQRCQQATAVHCYLVAVPVRGVGNGN